MAIAQFTGGPPGPQGSQGPANDRDINSMIMLSWMGGSPSVKSFDLYTNNFSSSAGIDSSSICNYNSLGYYEPTIAPGNYSNTYPINSTSYLNRTNQQGSIYRWFQDSNDTGHFEGVPQIISGAVVNLGGSPTNKVGLPSTNTLVSGITITIRGTVNYNGNFTVDSATTSGQIVIANPFTSEIISIAEASQLITLGSGGQNFNIQLGQVIEFPNYTRNILNITAPGSSYGQVQLSAPTPTSIITGIYDVSINAGVLSPSFYYSTTSSGWTKVFNGSPEGRRYAQMVYEPGGRNVWMFGGYKQYAAVRTNELWKYSTVSGQWTLMTPPSGPTAREGVAMVFDPVGSGIIMAGGYNGTTYYNDTWRYSVVSGTWTQLTPGGTAFAPTGLGYLEDGASVYVAASGTMLTWGGSLNGVRTNQMWEYNIGNNSWKQIIYGTGPTARWDHTGCFQTTSGAYFMFGGNTGSENAETWRYNYATTNIWTQLTSQISTFSAGIALYDGTSDYIYLLTGYVAATQTILGLFRYSISNNSWSYSVVPTGFGFDDTANNNVYSGTKWPAYTYDSDNKVFWIHHGGDSISSQILYRSRLIRFDPNALTWTVVHPEPRRRYMSAYNSKNNKIYIGMGGYPSDTSYQTYSDMWTFDCNQSNPINWSNLWTKLSFSTYPNATYVSWNYRDCTQWVYSPNLNSIFMFSGRGASAVNDLWKFDCNLGNWILLSPMGVWPAQRQEGLYAYDTDNDIFYIYTGFSNKSDWWKYDVMANVYVQLASPPVWPYNRQQGTLLYDVVNKCLWLYGGYNNSPWAVNRNDLWKYDIATSQWIQIIYGGYQPTATQVHSACFDPVSQSILIYGGSINNNYYRYDIRSNMMYQITDPAVSAGWYLGQVYKDQATSVFNTQTGDHYMFSGNTNVSWFNNELWKYNWWKPATPSGITTTTTSGFGINTSVWAGITNIVPSYTAPGSTDIYHAISFNNTSTFSILSTVLGTGLSSPINLGSGLVGFPVSNSFSVGNLIRVYGTQNYNYDYTVAPQTTISQIVVSGTYVPEAFTSSAVALQIMGWQNIVQTVSGIWQYYTGNTWNNAPINTTQNALLYALTVSGNRMNNVALSSIRSNEFLLPGGFVPGTTTSLEFGLGFQNAIPYVPQFNGYNIGYSTKSSNLTLITETWQSSSINPTSALCLIKVFYTGNIILNSDLTAWISTNNGINYDQISNLSILQTTGNYIILKGINTSLTAQNDNRIRFKILTQNSKYIAVASLGVALRY